MRRRRFIAAGTGVGLGLLAGCSGSSDGMSGDSTDSDTTDDAGAVGAFRLLISDQPAAIGDFDSLNVSLSKARIFRAGADETEEAETTEPAEDTATANATATAEATETETREETEETATTAETEATPTGEMEETEEADAETATEEGFVVRELDGATVDLTDVVGDRAISVLDGELDAGRYSKIELYAESVDGVVDGESVDVTIPSGKLQIIKSFEVVAGESVDFVFDINVVKKGNGGYNLLPVISEGGVAGRDVEVEEVDDEEMEATADGEADTTEEDATENETTGGNSTAGGRNETTAGE